VQRPRTLAAPTIVRDASALTPIERFDASIDASAPSADDDEGDLYDTARTPASSRAVRALAVVGYQCTRRVCIDDVRIDGARTQRVVIVPSMYAAPTKQTRFRLSGETALCVRRLITLWLIVLAIAGAQ
jgi:hypothetical protein